MKAPATESAELPGARFARHRAGYELPLHHAELATRRTAWQRARALGTPTGKQPLDGRDQVAAVGAEAPPHEQQASRRSLLKPDTTAGVGLAGYGLDGALDRAATVGLLLDA